MGREQKAEYYDEAFSKDKKYHGSYKNLPHFPVFQVALSYVKEMRNPYICEIGCGTGQFAQFLWNNWIREYMGVDFSTKAIDVARSLSPQVFKKVDSATSYNVPEEFDKIVSIEVFEHIEKDLEIINNVRQGDTVIFSVPRFDDPAHVRHFTSKEQVQERYGKLLKFEDLLKYQNWYIAKGVRNGTHNSTVSR